MTAKGPVSVFWQIIFVVFVPILDLWAFYRIAKLKKYLFYVYFPQIVVAIIFLIVVFGMVLEEDGIEKLENISNNIENNELFLMVPSIIIELGFIILSIYLIVKWSEKWNKQFQNSNEF